MKTAILVNGVPASGKSSVAKAVARHFAAPLMTLDTVKEPLFRQIGIGDREHNRKLGRASYEIIFAIIGEWPDPTTAVIDAWFGFQPPEVLERHLITAGISRTAELWCHAPGPVLAERYAARSANRSAGHPGLGYVPELLALNARVTPIGRGPCLPVDTTEELRLEAIASWLADALNIGRVPGGGIAWAVAEATGVASSGPEEKIDTSSAAGELVFPVFGAIAHVERRLIAERTKDGIAAARARDKKPGRQRLDVGEVQAALKLVRTGLSPTRRPASSDPGDRPSIARLPRRA